MGRLLGICCAALLIGIFILFGRLLLPEVEEPEKLQEVEHLSEDVTKPEDEKKDEEKPVESEEIATEEEAPEAVEDVLRSLEITSEPQAPALDAASLSAIEAALSGQLGSGDFASALDFESGGRIGGLGKRGELDSGLETIFDMTDIDQKPRAVFQAAPLYPSEMRGKKLEGVVTIIFVVDSNGRVSNPRIEKSTHPAFEKPTLDAIRQWKFEPAVKGGQRVGCKMRIPIRFQPS